MPFGAKVIVEKMRGRDVVERTRPATLFVASTAVLLATLPAAAKEYYVGEPVVQNEMKTVPHYLLLIEMAPIPKGAAMGPNAVHVEVNVHETNGEKHGFKEDEWIPYLTISYTIEKVGTKFKKTGALLAITAKEGIGRFWRRWRNLQMARLNS